MSKNQVTGCPCCGSRISFRQFVLLNNFSAINCDSCNARIEISNRAGNAVIAAVSGLASASAVVLCAYLGKQQFQSLFLGLFTGIVLAVIIIAIICRVLYKRSHLYRSLTSQRLQY
jgi:DNA-directed RNA polymerase subunit RPC12/RpoP